MRIALIGHSYHGKTRSTQFFLDLLAELGTLDVFWDESWDGRSRVWAPDFEAARYDLIVVFQAHEALQHLDWRHPNVVFIPMYDAMMWHDAFFWRSSFGRFRILSFSWQLRSELMRRGVTPAHFQYFPDPEEEEPISDFGDLRGFLWYRKRDVSPALVFELSRRTEFTRFHVHNAPDPENELRDGLTCPPNIAKLDVSQWLESASAYRDLLREHNVFFAPRAHEGIGMGFLEAMALGHCVVAPANPTMTEYISDGTNGLLYSLADPTPLDLSRARELGARARESIERGYRRWRSDVPRLLEFLASPGRDRGQGVVNPGGHVLPSSAPPAPGRRPSDKPLVSVVTVCRNAAADLEKTMQSVLAQDLEGCEYLVLDGASQDGTLEIVRRYASRLSRWESEPDEGVYHAMNKALGMVQGDWVLFMNAGDSFVDATALSRMFERVPDGADVVFGHHIYRLLECDMLSRAAEFESTWTQLREGRLRSGWLSGIPGHQATAIRRDLIARLRFDTRYAIAADHDLLFRARSEGARFFNCDELLSIYVGGGLSDRQYDRCTREWLDIATAYGGPSVADQLVKDLGLTAADTLRRFAHRTIVAVERIIPPFGMLAHKLIARRSTRALGKAVIRLVTGGRTESGETANPARSNGAREIDFRAVGWPSCVRAAEGFADREPWGRRLQGPSAAISFTTALPRTFELLIEAHAVGAGPRLVSVEVGACRAALTVSSKADRFYSVPLVNAQGADKLLFTVVEPATGGDVGLVSMRIVEPGGNAAGTGGS